MRPARAAGVIKIYPGQPGRGKFVGPPWDPMGPQGTPWDPRDPRDPQGLKLWVLSASLYFCATVCICVFSDRLYNLLG